MATFRRTLKITSFGLKSSGLVEADSRRLVVATLGVVIAPTILCVLASAAQAQTQAACTFAFFDLGVDIPNLGPGFIAPAGINDFRTIVGTAIPTDESAPRVAFVRWANGGFDFPLGTGGPSELVDRNDVGVSIGDIGGVPILLDGTTVTDITLNNPQPAVQLQAVNRINRWGSIAGKSSDRKKEKAGEQGEETHRNSLGSAAALEVAPVVGVALEYV